MFNSEKPPDTWFINFLKKANQNSDILAIELALEEIKKGKTISKLIKNENYYSLSVKKLNNELKYIIEFDCNPGSLTGDGGEWVVQFDKVGKVTSIEKGTRWIS